MTNGSLSLDKVGVYLFPAPTRVTARIDRELLVVVFLPSSRACGFVLYDPEQAQKELYAMLDRLFDKIDRTSPLQEGSAIVKLFGLSRAPSQILTGLELWMNSRSLSPVVRDVGKNVGRQIVVDCETGRVGVSYAEAYLPGFPQFLARGTARHRANALTPEHEALILSHNPVHRQLIAQAIEEQPGWITAAPHKPDEMWEGKEFPYFPWAWVFLDRDLGQDLGSMGPLFEWAHAIRKNYPAVRFCWIGSEAPKALGDLSVISLINPAAPGELKSQLGRLLAPGAPDHAPADVIPIRKRKS